LRHSEERHHFHGRSFKQALDGSKFAKAKQRGASLCIARGAVNSTEYFRNAREQTGVDERAQTILQPRVVGDRRCRELHRFGDVNLPCLVVLFEPIEDKTTTM
jgi:hypothetical protein